jgi:hypothetical protein
MVTYWVGKEGATNESGLVLSDTSQRAGIKTDFSKTKNSDRDLKSCAKTRKNQRSSFSETLRDLIGGEVRAAGALTVGSAGLSQRTCSQVITCKSAGVVTLGGLHPLSPINGESKTEAGQMASDSDPFYPSFGEQPTPSVEGELQKLHDDLCSTASLLRRQSCTNAPDAGTVAI